MTYSCTLPAPIAFTNTVLVSNRPSRDVTTTANAYFTGTVMVLAGMVMTLSVAFLGMTAPQSLPKSLSDAILHVHWEVDVRE